MNKVFKLGNGNLIQVNTFNRNLKGGKYNLEGYSTLVTSLKPVSSLQQYALHILLTYDT